MENHNEQQKEHRFLKFTQKRGYKIAMSIVAIVLVALAIYVNYLH